METKVYSLDEANKIAEFNKNEVKNLPSLYPHLKANPVNAKEEKANLVAELKKHFPSIKFSVTKDGYSTIRIKWENGPTMAEVAAISNKFESYESSYCGDYRDPAPTNFNNVFGGFKYVFTSRTQSADINALLPKMVELLEDYKGEYPEQILYRLFCKMSIPVNASNFELIKTGVTCGSIEDFYAITYTLPNEETKKETILGDFELETGETFVNNLNKHILYKIDYLNAMGIYSYYYDVLKPAESLTKTNPLNKVKIFI